MAKIQDIFSSIISLALIGIGLFMVGACLEEPTAHGVASIKIPILCDVASSVHFLLFTPGWGTVLTLASIGVISTTFRIRL